MADFKVGAIDGVKVVPFKKWIDERGWLLETFRNDEIEHVYRPVMGYTSMTRPETVRGPHEHVEQADLFVFMGPGNFKIYLWDNRKHSPTYWMRQVFFAGEDNPMQVLVPPGVVHAYKNVSSYDAMVHNFPNQLYAGKGKVFPVDEIRHEKDESSPFKVG